MSNHLKLAIVSDLHLEGSNCALNLEGADLLIVAGDLWAGPHSEEGLYWLRRQVGALPTLFVPGNHEFERAEIEGTMARLRLAAYSKRSAVHVLFNQSFDFQGVRFLGTPLFSGFDWHWDTPYPLSQGELMARASREIVDFDRYFGSTLADGSRWSPSLMWEWHNAAVSWLDHELTKAEKDHLPVVVITHWAPHAKSADPHFRGNHLSGYWVNHEEWLVKRANLWVHGHVHSSSHYRVGSDPRRGEVICNPRGYSKIFNLAQNLSFANPKLIDFAW